MSNKILRTPSGGKIKRAPLHSLSKKTSQLFINKGVGHELLTCPFHGSPPKINICSNLAISASSCLSIDPAHTRTQRMPKLETQFFFAFLLKCFEEGPFFLAARLFFHKLLVNIVNVESIQSFCRRARHLVSSVKFVS